MQRKDFFKDGIKELGKELMGTPVGGIIDRQLTAFSNLLSPEWLEDKHREKQKRESGKVDEDADMHSAEHGHHSVNGPAIKMPRPPGAIPDRIKFQKACTQCNDCIMACPHGAIISIGPFSGPVLDTNLFPCYLCEDYPCISSCEPGALLTLPENTIPKMGQARLVESHCLNFGHFPAPKGEKHSQCKVCKTVCPVTQVVTFDSKTKLPKFADHCAGCGLCVKACPAVPLAIRVDY
jgi:ferredoxin